MSMHSEGWSAYFNGYSRGMNPYVTEDYRHKEWDQGWADAKKEFGFGAPPAGR